MTNNQQINEFIEKHKIKDELQKLFNINCNHLEFKDKNYKIAVDDIDYKKSILKFHLFKTPILKHDKQVGYFAVEYDLNFNLVDDFFVIYDEIGILINKIAQDKINFEEGKNLIFENEDYNFDESFNILRDYIFNSIPDKIDYNSEVYQESIKTIPLKQASTPIKILSKFPTKIAFHKLKELPQSEHSKILTSLLWIYKITDTKRRETECKNDCTHLWHNLV